MNNTGAVTATRAIVSAILLVALIAGIIFVGNYYGDNNTGDSAVYIEEQGVKTVMLDENADEYDFKISFGTIDFRTTTQTPYITVENAPALNVYADYSKGRYNISFNNNGHGLFSFIDNLIAHKSYNPKISIYLPEDKLKRVEVKVSSGNVDMRDINTDYLSLDVSTGNLMVKDCEATAIKTELSAGKLECYLSPQAKSVETQVSAGKMNLYIPNDIAGFKINYDISAGSIINNSDFEIGSMSDGLKIKDTRTYGDESCEIALDVSAGTIMIDDYN